MRVVTFALLTSGFCLLSGPPGWAQQQQRPTGMCSMPMARAAEPGTVPVVCPCMQMMAMMMAPGGMTGGQPGRGSAAPAPTPQPQQPQ